MTRASDAGFTLVEALVAFAILAVVMVASYQAAGTGLRALDTAATNEGAVLAAQSLMDRIVAERRRPQPASGAVDGTPYSWSLEVKPADPAWSRQPLARKPVNVRVIISWRARSGTSRIHLDRVIFVDGAPAP